MTSLSPIQLALLGALGGSVLSVFVPSFLRNVHASRLAEAQDGLQVLAGAASMYSAGSPPLLAYPPGAPRTPAEIPSGAPVIDPDGTWLHPTWQVLGFSMTEQHYYSFSFESETDEGGAVFTAKAEGDLDGDGESSLFSVTGETRGSHHPRLYPMRIVREFE